MILGTPVWQQWNCLWRSVLKEPDGWSSLFVLGHCSLHQLNLVKVLRSLMALLSSSSLNPYNLRGRPTSATWVTVSLHVISKVSSAANCGAQSSNWVSCSSGWNLAGITQSQQSFTVSVAGDYLHMLRKAWNIPSGTPQFNAGCRRLAKIQYAPETGMGDMPPVEREMAALTSLGPERVTANPRCPLKECDKSVRLVCRTYNAATRAACSGNALTILLAALRRTANPEEQDTMSLLESALVTHFQLTRDIGAAMSSAMMSQRQIGLAETTLPEKMTNMPIVPAHVFHPDSQGLLDKAERSRSTRECVQRTFRGAVTTRYKPRGSQSSHQSSSVACMEPWVYGRGQATAGVPM